MPRPATPCLCKKCGYDLSGCCTRQSYLVTCPECGLTGPIAFIAQPAYRPWPSVPRMLPNLSGPTVLLCSLCALATAIPVLWPLNIGLVPVAFLSGPVVPVIAAYRLARRHSPRGARLVHAAGVVALGWLLNLFVGGGFLAIGAVLLNLHAALFHD